jgi:uncharacterized membrane protein
MLFVVWLADRVAPVNFVVVVSVQAESRQVRRLMEKDNLKERDRGKR